MKLRLKVVMLLALLSAVASASIGAWSYFATAARLREEVDLGLSEAADGVVGWAQRESGPFADAARADAVLLTLARRAEVLPEFQRLVVQVLGPDGTVGSPDGVVLPVSSAEGALAQRGEPGVERWRGVMVGGVRHRLLTVSLGDGEGAVQLARDLTDTSELLQSLRRRIGTATAAVAAAAALVGWLTARRLTARLEGLADSAEAVAATGRLDLPVPGAGAGADEVSRVARGFERMLTTLAESKDTQRRLVEDAGHELRTPLTSLRTNVEVLRRHRHLPPEDMEPLLDDLDSESRELAALVEELVALATETRRPGSRGQDDDVPLGPLVEQAAERLRRRTGRQVVATVDGSVVHGDRSSLLRAVSNLLDNAAKFAPDGVIEVDVSGGVVEVRDRGPGIQPDELERVFDRFHRSATARSLPGSGLGLAIVSQVAEDHGGTAVAANRPGGGAAVGMRLPVVAPG